MLVFDIYYSYNIYTVETFPNASIIGIPSLTVFNRFSFDRTAAVTLCNDIKNKEERSK